MQKSVSILSLLEGAIEDVERRHLPPTALLDYLGLIADRLGDRLLPAFEWNLEDTALNLTTYVTSEGVSIFAVVTSDMRLLIGRSDRKGPSQKLIEHRFKDVAPETHELMALVVGALVDVDGGAEIRVQFQTLPRRNEGREDHTVLLYRGHVTVQKDGPLIVGFDPLRKPVGSSELRRALVRGDVDADPCSNLLSESAIHDLERAQLPNDVQSVCWSDGLMAHCRGDGFVTLEEGSRSTRIMLPPGDHARAMTLYDARGKVPRDDAGSVFLALVTDDRRAVVYRFDRGGDDWNHEPWLNQRLFLDHPRLAAFAPTETGYPLLLVAHRDKTLVVYEFCSANRSRELWQRGWETLVRIADLHAPRAWLEWARAELRSMPSSLPPGVHGGTQGAIDRYRAEPISILRPRALFLRMLESLIDAPPPTPAEIRTSLLDLLFDVDDDRATFEPLRETLRRVREEMDLAVRAPAATFTRLEQTARVLMDAYERVSWAVRDSIDAEIRDLDTNDVKSLKETSPSLSRLMQRALDTRDSLWKRTENATTGEELSLRATCAIGRKHNALLLTDARKVRDFQGRRMHRLIASLRTTAHDGTGPGVALVLADPHRILTVALDGDHKLCAAETVLALDPEHASPIVGITSVPTPEGDLLATLNDDGTVRIDSLVRVAGRFELVACCAGDVKCGAAHPPSRARCVAAALVGKHALLAIVANTLEDPRSSCVHVFRLVGGRLHRVWEFCVSDVAVQCIDIARVGDDECNLLVGGGSEARALLYRLRLNASTSAYPPIDRQFDSRVFAVRMERDDDPRYAAIGERDGLIWGFDLRPHDRLTRLIWIHRAEGAVREMTRLELDGDAHFAVLMETGSVVCLRARDGRLIWKRKFGELLFGGVGFKSPGGMGALAIVLPDGRLSLYRVLELREREAAASELPRLLERLDTSGVVDVPNVGGKSLKVLDAIRLRKRLPLEKVLQGVRSWRGRMYFLLECIAENDPELTPTIRSSISHQEESLIHAVMGPDDPRWNPWFEPAPEEHEIKRPRRGDNSKLAFVAATMMRLWRAGISSPTREQLLRFKVPEGMFQDRWFCLEYARLLLRATHREYPRQEDTIVQLLCSVVHFPLGLLYALARVCPTDIPLKRCIDGFSTIARRGADDENQPSNEVLESLADDLEAVEGQLADARLIRTMCLFHSEGRTFLRQRTKDRRIALLKSFKDLHDCIRRRLDEFVFERGFVTALRNMVDNDSFPLSTVRLHDQIRWFQNTAACARAVGLEPKLDVGEAMTPGWRRVHEGLLRRAAILVEQISIVEVLELRRTTRLYPRNFQVELGATDARLVLDLELDGMAPAAEAAMVVDATSENGLGALGSLPNRWKTTVQRVAAGWHEQVELRGQVRPQQKTISVEMRTTTERICCERWEFRVPPRIPFDRYRPYPDVLGRAYRRLIERAFAPDANVTVLAMDDTLGAAELVERAASERPVILRDIDADTFQVGRHGHIWWDGAQLLDHFIHGANTGTRAPRPGDRVLAYPCGQFLRRLATEQPTIFQSFLLELDEHARRKDVVSLLLVVPFEVAFALDRRLADSIRRLWSHRAADHDELCQWLQTLGYDHRSADSLIAWCGGDLRLLQQTLQHLERSRDAHDWRIELKPLRERILMEELRALDLAAVAVVIAASLGRCAVSSDATTTSTGGHDLSPNGRNLSVFQKVLEGLLTPAEIQARARRLVDRGLLLESDSVLRPSALLRVQLDLSSAHEVRHTLRDNIQAEVALARKIRGDGSTLLEGVPFDRLVGLKSATRRAALAEVRAGVLDLFHELLQRWTSGPVQDRGDAEFWSAMLGEPVQPITPEQRSGRNDEPIGALVRVGVRGFAVGATQVGDYHERYVLWVERGHPLDPNAVQQAVEQTSQRVAAWLRQRKQEGSGLLFVALTGPGAAETSRGENVAVLTEQDLVWCFTRSDAKPVSSHLSDVMKRKTKLTLFSPYRSSGALPPGSNLFRGRDAEFKFITSGITRQSTLIVGGRRIGKSSLLNRVYNWARQQASLEAFHVDCQGIETAADFAVQLRASSSLRGVSDPVETVEALCRDALSRQKTPVFFLNEIDLLVERDPRFVERLRSLHEAGNARFVMVGYAPAEEAIRSPTTPLHHFCVGMNGRPAIYLRELEVRAAVSLIDLLTEPPLNLHWSDERLQRQTIARILDQSARIPWVIQAICHSLVERLDESGRDVVTSQEVEFVLSRCRDLLWSYFDRLDASLVYGQQTRRRPGVQEGLRLILLAVVRDRYFAKRRAEMLDIIQQRSPLDLAFTVDDALTLSTLAVKQLLIGKEAVTVQGWMKSNREQVAEGLRRLTVTILLEPDPAQDGRYAFAMHLYPKELLRKKATDGDADLARLFLDYAREFLRALNVGN